MSPRAGRTTGASFHHGVVVGRFWVGPPWEEAPAGVEAVVIDPGRAFGTGAHPTTRLTLELLQELEPGSLLDVGCGSGVLSIAAAKLGFAPVVAIDVDADAVEVTLENARPNGVEIAAPRRATRSRTSCPATDARRRERRARRRRGAAAASRRGRVVTSGYLERRRAATSRAGGRVERRERDGWAADLLERA